MRLLWFLQKPMHNYSYIKKSRDIRIAGSISSILLLLIFITTICPIVIHVSSIEATGTASNSYINISQGKSSAGLELLVHNTDGTFATTTESDLAEFGVTTNNSSGYTLTISGNENSSNLTNVTTGTSFTSISNATTAAAFDNSVFNGKWGYKPSKYNSSDNSDFLPAPTTTASTLDTTAIANSNANIYTIALGARADYSTPAGTYTNTFTLSAVGNPVTYTLNFADNTGDNSIANMPETLSSTTMKTSVALPTNIPTRTGYTFAGWCDGTATNNDTSCSGTIYQPSTVSSTVYFDFINQTSVTNIATLYTTWTPNVHNLTIDFAGTGVESVKICSVTGNCTGNNIKGTVSTSGGSVSNLQESTAYYLYPTFTDGYGLDSWVKISSQGSLSSTTAANPSFTIGTADGRVRIVGKTNMMALQDVTLSTCPTSPQEVYDNRDDQIYTIQKLADGNCWMLNNLNLGATTLTRDLTSANTNLTTTIVASTFNSWKKSSGSGAYTDGEFIPITTSNSANGLDTDSVSMTKYGTLYNYYTTSAGTFSLGLNRITQDICPKGWRLPIGGEAGEFQVLYDNQNYNSINKMRGSIQDGGLAFNLAGFFYLSTPMSQGTNSAYWSSTINKKTDSSSIHALTVSDTNVSPDASNIGYQRGGSVRCMIGETEKHYTVTVNFAGAGVSSVSFSANGESTKTVSSSGGTVSLTYGVEYNLSMSLASGSEFVSWGLNKLNDYYSYGTIGSTSTNPTTFTIRPTNNAVITATGKISDVDLGYLQDLTASTCAAKATGPTAIATDRRDNQVYSVRYINGGCWMTRNLAIGCNGSGTSYGDTMVSKYLTSSYSNVSSGWYTPTASLTTTEDYSVPKMACSSKYGGYYNYAAASVGTITTNNNSDTVTYDICPKGWKLPTQSEFATITSYKDEFNVVVSGRYVYESFNSSYGYWWSSSLYNPGNGGNKVYRHMLFYNNATSTLSATNFQTRTSGLSVRCKLK
ncbi:hypothetical protein J6S55_01130 [Candidatus Saccharibacteria bacterium]|nr:hypothetical protein [Candidatus Saccharibacteria bacterium]